MLVNLPSHAKAPLEAICAGTARPPRCPCEFRALASQDLLKCSTQSLFLSVTRMPAANQFPLPAVRIRSIGLAQSAVGIGLSTSSILKSPLAASGTPAVSVLCSINGAILSQINVANTNWPVALPALFPPAKTSPLPSTLMSPLVFIRAFRSLILQSWPGG
jgi:hypothetical protein